MKHLKSRINILEFLEILKSYEWGRRETDINLIRKNTNHFIGSGYYEKISSIVDRMVSSLEKVDTHYINMRMYDVYDNCLQAEDIKSTKLAISYGDYDKDGYNGLLYFPSSKNNKLHESNKIRVIIHIIKEIIYPTINISRMNLRSTEDMLYVTDDKWNCVNFDIKNYNVKVGDKFISPYTNRESQILNHDIDKYKKYSVDNVINKYKPCIAVTIGDSHMGAKFNLKKLESEIDEALPSILPTIDYSEVIFDLHRDTRRFDNDSDFTEYTLKILLNF